MASSEKDKAATVFSATAMTQMQNALDTLHMALSKVGAGWEFWKPKINTYREYQLKKSCLALAKTQGKWRLFQQEHVLPMPGWRIYLTQTQNGKTKIQFR